MPEAMPALCECVSRNQSMQVAWELVAELRGRLVDTLEQGKQSADSESRVFTMIRVWGFCGRSGKPFAKGLRVYGGGFCRSSTLCLTSEISSWMQVTSGIIVIVSCSENALSRHTARPQYGCNKGSEKNTGSVPLWSSPAHKL